MREFIEGVVVMKMNFWKLPVTTILSIGLLLTVTAGTTLASEEGVEGSFWDHQEMALTTYEGDSADFSSAEVAETLDAFKDMVKADGEVEAISVDASSFKGQVTVKRPVNILVEGYDSPESAGQKDVKLTIDLPEKLDENAPLSMTIQGIPEDHITIKSLGPVTLYVAETGTEGEEQPKEDQKENAEEKQPEDQGNESKEPESAPKDDASSVVSE